MTWNDELVDEIRRARNEHAERFKYDISAICADIRQKQKESGRKIVSLEKTSTEDDNLTFERWRKKLT